MILVFQTSIIFLGLLQVHGSKDHIIVCIIRLTCQMRFYVKQLMINLPHEVVPVSYTHLVVAEADGVVLSSESNKIVIREKDGKAREYKLTKFSRSNQSLSLIHI